MNKAFLMILVYTVSLFLLPSCSSDSSDEKITQQQGPNRNQAYSIRDGRVFFQGKPVEDADHSSFVTLGTGRVYGKDSRRVYFSGNTIFEADPATFHVLSESVFSSASGPDAPFSYGKDAHYVYFQGHRITEADAGTFKVLDVLCGYAVDERFVWYQWLPVHGADPESFQAVTKNKGDMPCMGSLKRYFKDKYQVFYGLYPLIGAKPEGFEVLDAEEVFATDGTRVYAMGAELDQADVLTFQTLGSGFAKDASHVWYLGDVLFQADPLSFRSLGKGYGKDTLQVWLHNRILTRADAGSFSLLDGPYARDARHVWHEHSPIVGADVSSFNVIAFSESHSRLDNSRQQKLSYASDFRQVYLNAVPVQHADPASFTVINRERGLGRDTEHFFFLWDAQPSVQGEKIAQLSASTCYFTDGQQIFYAPDWENFSAEGDTLRLLLADVHSFSIDSQNSLYGKDSHAVFFKGQVIPGAKPASFRTLSATEHYAHDAESLFYQTRRIGCTAVNSDDTALKKNVSRVDPDQVMILSSLLFTPLEKKSRGQYAKDTTHVFFNGMELPGDPSSFQVDLPYVGFSHDNKTVFLENIPIADLDASTFTPFFRLAAGVPIIGAVDSNGIWIQSGLKSPFNGPLHPMPVPERDMGWILGRNNAAYLSAGGAAVTVVQVDTQTFSPLPVCLPDASSPRYLSSTRYAKDQKRVYFQGKLVPNADSHSFRPLPLIEEPLPAALPDITRLVEGVNGGHGAGVDRTHFYLDAQRNVSFNGILKQIWPRKAGPDSCLVFVDSERAYFLTHPCHQAYLSTAEVDIPSFSVLCRLSSVEVISADNQGLYYNEMFYPGLTTAGVSIWPLTSVYPSEKNIQTGATFSQAREVRETPLFPDGSVNEYSLYQLVVLGRPRVCFAVERALAVTGYGVVTVRNSITKEEVRIGENGKILLEKKRDGVGVKAFDGRFYIELGQEDRVWEHGEFPGSSPWSLVTNLRNFGGPL